MDYQTQVVIFNPKDTSRSQLCFFKMGNGFGIHK